MHTVNPAEQLTGLNKITWDEVSVVCGAKASDETLQLWDRPLLSSPGKFGVLGFISHADTVLHIRAASCEKADTWVMMVTRTGDQQDENDDILTR